MTKNRIVVCDAGPIIHLDELDCLDTLSDFDEIFVPDVVWKEVERHRVLAFEKSGISFKRCPSEAISDEPLFTICRFFSLDAGEIEALAIMNNIPDALFITDDAAARMVAEQMKFTVHGTIGILVRAIRKKKRTPQEVIELLKKIPQFSTLYIKKSLLEQIILKVKEEFQL